MVTKCTNEYFFTILELLCSMSCLLVKFSYISCSLHRLFSQSHSSIPAATSAQADDGPPNRSPQFYRRFIPFLSARAQMPNMMRKNLVVLMLITASWTELHVTSNQVPIKDKYYSKISETHQLSHALMPDSVRASANFLMSGPLFLMRSILWLILRAEARDNAGPPFN